MSTWKVNLRSRVDGKRHLLFLESFVQPYIAVLLQRLEVPLCFSACVSSRRRSFALALVLNASAFAPQSSLRASLMSIP